VENTLPEATLHYEPHDRFEGQNGKGIIERDKVRVQQESKTLSIFPGAAR
jgi:hypothetical protein